MGRSKKLPPIHPGEILLEEFLKPLGMSMNKLAEKLHVPANRITQIVEGRRGVTGETALRLALLWYICRVLARHAEGL